MDDRGREIRQPKTVHYRQPAVCSGFSAGDLWTGNLDRVNCELCLAEADEAAWTAHMAEKWGV